MFVLGYLAEDASHDLAGPGLGQTIGELQMVGRGDGADLFAHMSAQFCIKFIRRLFACVEGDVAIDALPLDVVRVANNRGFGDLGMARQRTFDFGCAQAVAGNIDHIIYAPCDPVVAVLVTSAAVTGKIFAAVRAEIGLLEPRMVSIDRSCLTGPARGNAQMALARAFQNHAVAIDQFRPDSEEGLACAARFHVMRGWQCGDHHAARLCLPPSVDYRAPLFAHDIEIPAPCLGVDRLTHRTQQAERGTVARCYETTPLSHQCADRSGGSIENVYRMLRDHIPHAAMVGIIRHTFEDDLRGAVEQWAVNDITMAGNPANIGCTPEDFPLLVVENISESRRRPHAVASSRVDNALGLAGRA